MNTQRVEDRTICNNLIKIWEEGDEVVAVMRLPLKHKEYPHVREIVFACKKEGDFERKILEAFIETMLKEMTPQ